MDNKALAETYIGLYKYIEGNFETQTGAMPTTEETNMIFEQTCKRIISDLIGKQRQGVPSQQKQGSDDKPTDKQMSFAAKLGCKNASEYTKQGLSLWIEEHKDF